MKKRFGWESIPYNRTRPKRFRLRYNSHICQCFVFFFCTDFTVLDTACCGEGQFGASGCNFSAPLCPSRSNHLFWDNYHPTEAVSQIAAKIIFGGNGTFVHPVNVQQLVASAASRP